jgi:hypothetical protein
MGSFFTWLMEVICALGAYTLLSRWIHQGERKGLFENLVPELATFAALYLLLRLAFKALGSAWRKRKAPRTA